MNEYLKLILNYLKEKRGFDFSGFRSTMVERRVTKRFQSTKCQNYGEYLHYLKEYPEELDHLVDVLTINVSRFFRDTLTFEYIADRVLPFIVHEKEASSDHSLRIWSAGCAMGEEPYSVAILVNEILKKEGLNLSPDIFATDINGNTLQKARKAAYAFESIKSVKYRLLTRYFQAEGETFKLIPEITKRVRFSVYDLLDKKSHAPPESIYGHFDMVLCRNVLIYFDMAYQDMIFEKLYRSLATHGYLVLGEAETPSIKYQRRFKRVNSCCHIYQKR